MRPSVLGAGALVLVCATFLGYVALSSQRRGDDLLAKVRTEASAAPASTPAPADPSPTSPLAVAAPAPAADSAAAAPSPAATSSASPSGRAAADIDAMLAQTYGGRPRVLGDGTLASIPAAPAPAPRPKPVPAGPAWLVRAQRIDAPAAPAPSGPKLYGVPTGAHIRARLVGNLDSRTIGSGPVEVTLTRPFLVAGEPVFPSRTMIYGTASTNGDRFDIRFTRVRLPDRTEIKIAGLAYDREDRKPGLPASRKIAAASQPASEGLGTRVAKGAANVALGQLSGGTAQDIARGAGSTVVNASEDPASAPREALLLDAGLDFDVFVQEPF